jgi:DNA-binding Lrp family transcriptional regulator
MGINVEPGFAYRTTEGLSNLEEVLEVHEMHHNRFDLFLKIRAKDMNHMRDIIENKIKLPNILETELMTVLKTKRKIK